MRTPTWTRLLAGALLPLAFASACGVTGGSSSTLDAACDPECSGADAGRDAAGDGGAPAADAARLDATPGPADAALVDAAPGPADAAVVDPACDVRSYAIDPFSNQSRSDALAVAFDYRVYVLGVRPSGDTSGWPPRQYASFTVVTPRSVEVSFSGSQSYAAFYFEGETSSRFSLGATVSSRHGVPLEAGKYTIEIGDTTPHYFGDGRTWEVYMDWSVPPAACADGGVEDAGLTDAAAAG
jgi:hypothetical protein